MQLPNSCLQEAPLPFQDILHYFSQFGPVTDVKMMHNADGTSKGDCFVTFESAESAQAVYANYDHNMIDGKWVDCKPSDGGGTKPKPGDWWCPMCGDLVFASRSVCNMCGYSGGGGTQVCAGLRFVLIVVLMSVSSLLSRSYS